MNVGGDTDELREALERSDRLMRGLFRQLPPNEPADERLARAIRLARDQIRANEVLLASRAAGERAESARGQAGAQNGEAAGGEGETRARVEVDEGGERAPPAEPDVRSARLDQSETKPSVEQSIDLNDGSLDDYRGLGMSLTQAKRVIEYRERFGGYSSVDQLDEVPGFPRQLRAELKRRLTV